ncbi:CHAT domain-containing protein [Corallococcus sp. Z5C101001]|uniref:CHAT domain-containing protein n=1 Tax=Corallococcus sp. Z5C101001 TaxID=2596829 RepID=UPI00117C427D|nr:CHAT domain-containing protein [Corallococcus sp. Z5C101001]TSC34516.1 CHAT domain-containing protein [Corallococcus sp. Z5C101001]
MAGPCDNVAAFVDGELSSDEAEVFRQHLPDCARCQREIPLLLQLDFLGRELVERAPTPMEVLRSVPFPRNGWRRPVSLVAASFAAGLLVAIVGARFIPQQPSARLAISPSAYRLLEPRLSPPDADVYRKLPDRLMSSGAGANTEGIPHALLGELRTRNDLQELSAALLAQNQAVLAEEALVKLDGLAASAEKESDRAAALLILSRHGEALKAADRALAMRPGMPQALWNRALALRELHLPRLAARVFDQVTTLGEAGWAEEASRNVAGLRRASMDGEERWHSVEEAGRALLEGVPDLLPAGFSQAPSARLYFYDAVRAAPDRSRVMALLPLAQSLDARAGGQVLQDYVRRISAADFSRRAPLARDYAELVRALRAQALGLPMTESQKDWLSETRQAAFVATLRASGEEDVLLGVLVLTGAVRGDLPRFESAASTDPWFALTVARERSAEQWRGPHREQALRTLLEAYRLFCSISGLDYRCIQIDIDLSDRSIQLHQLAEANKYAERGRQRAREGSEWFLERDLLWNLAQSAKFAGTVPHLARAYYSEYLEREPGNLDARRAVYQHLADIAWNELSVDEARMDMELALATGRPLPVSGAFTLADLARLKSGPGDEARLTTVLESLPASKPDERWVAAHALGRFVIEHDVIRGRALLRDLLQQVAGPADTGNPTARRVRAYSFTSLLFEAGKRGGFEEALGLFSEERGMPLPARCLLAATVDSERTLLIVRGAQGELVGDYDDSRRQRLPSRVEGLVKKEELLAPLRACEQVEVLARPPLHGRVGLLPASFAWSYLTRRSTARIPPKPGPGLHLVVSEVELPAELSLPSLSWTPSFGPDEKHLLISGARATAANVLAAMEDATEIDLVTHGNIHDSASTSYLLLAPDMEGPELTLSRIRTTSLRGAPFVMLAACKAAHTTYAVHEPLSIPAAFFEIGARGVLAATQDIYNEEANAFFNDIRERMRSGVLPAVALRDVRQEWLGAGRGTTWVNSVLLFE